MYENIVRTLGAIFDNRALYGTKHQVAVQSMELAFEQLSQMLTTEGSLLLTIGPDECHINRQLVDARNPLVQRFFELLRAHDLSTLTLTDGLTPDEFIAFVELLAQSPESLASSGGIAQGLNVDTFAHIESRKVTYVEINEDEIVIQKEALGEGHARGARDAAVMEYLGVSEDAHATSPAPSEAVTAGIQELLGAPAELGEIILQSAGASLSLELPSTEAVPENVTQELIDRIVKCLERAFGVLKEERSARSQKGKKALIKSLKTLETDLETVIRDSISPIGEEDLAPISSAVEAMTDELAIDALASEYLRKRKLIEESEARMLRYMARRGEDVVEGDLKDKLIEGGLPPHNWEMLLFTSGAKPVPTTTGDEALDTGIPGFRHLQEVLGQLAECFRDADPDNAESREKLAALIAQVEGRLEALVKNTRRRMESLSESVALSGAAPETLGGNPSRRPSRRKIFEMIAEIVQELCQPLSVVQCTVDVLVTGQLGEMSPRPQELLELASRSANRLSTLINELYLIVGPPTQLEPKERDGNTPP